MRKPTYISAFLLLCVLLVAGGMLLPLQAQNNTSSPFSCFGYGELNDNVPGQLRSMGGVWTGMRDKRVINPAQPASYSVVDSTTFMFDLGASVMWTNYGDSKGVKNLANGNLEYLTIQFPIWKYIGFSVGVLPYSMVGYDITDSVKSVPHPYTKVYTGEGGITEVYGGLSFNILNWAAVGANVYYMFGNVLNNRALVFNEAGINSALQTSMTHVSDYRLRYGAQLFHTFGKHGVVLGAVFENKKPFRVTYLEEETLTADTVGYLVNGGFDLPMMFSVGASYCYDNRLLLAADYGMTAWGDIRYKWGPNLRNRQRFAFGAEYRHNPLGRRYVERMPFRFGLSMTDPYVNEINSRDYTVSIGVGFPLRNVNTVINASLEYGHRGSAAVMQENYLRLTINAGIAETWFFKRRL